MGRKETMEFDTTFFEKDVTIIHPHDNDPMLIIVRCDDWEIKRVLNYQWSSTNILYLDAFERLLVDQDNLKVFEGSLVRFSDEHVQVKGYNTLKIIF